jgi:hypothetical protein
MQIFRIAVVLAMLGSASVAQTGTPQGYIGAYGPDSQIKSLEGPCPKCIRVRAGT